MHCSFQYHRHRAQTLQTAKNLDFGWSGDVTPRVLQRAGRPALRGHRIVLPQNIRSQGGFRQGAEGSTQLEEECGGGRTFSQWQVSLQQSSVFVRTEIPLQSSQPQASLCLNSEKELVWSCHIVPFFPCGQAFVLN